MKSRNVVNVDVNGSLTRQANVPAASNLTEPLTPLRTKAHSKMSGFNMSSHRVPAEMKVAVFLNSSGTEPEI